MLIKNYKHLATSPARRQALQIINAGLKAVAAEKIIREQVKLKGNILWVKKRNFDLTKHKKIVVIGFGKASALMAKEMENILGKKIHSGIVVSTMLVRLKRIWTFRGTHPLCSKVNVKITKKIVKLIRRLDKKDLVICLVSGGGSSLLCYPTIPLKQYISLMEKTLNSGIEIKKFNEIRKELSYVKGGKLAQLTKAKIISLIFSDVIGDDLSTIASGPTVGPNVKNATNLLLLNNLTALEAMKQKAIQLGLKPKIMSTKLAGEAKKTGLRIVKEIPKNTVLLFGGETTVKVSGQGKGGRCQEMCLGALEKVAGLKNAVLACVDTDGQDGSSSAAGSLIDQLSFAQAQKQGLNYQKYLKDNNSHYFFKKIKSSVLTGLTGSNVGDIVLFLKK